ncbi:hypothetical protein SteCoe_421 [Stentor coeruleus]|uniref:Uncharacterized protein n=1 Tax=Stentor coeruleus TaxID=5963 RepID=A0A1R2D451_9CILI|nr:hypothetical protein SteCoe_421 [Stentor coeruleus]
MKNFSKECTVLNIPNIISQPSLKSIINELNHAESQICNFTYEHSARILSLAISKDGLTAFAGCEDSVILIINLITYYLEETLNGHTKEIRGIKLSSDNEVMTSISADGVIKCWDTTTRKELDYIDISPYIPETFIVGPYGKVIYIGSDDINIVIWEREKPGKIYYLAAHTDSINSLGLFMNFSTLVSASKDFSVRLWDTTTKECSGVLHGHTSWVTCLALANKKCLAISGSEDKSIRVWNIKNHKEDNVFKGHTGEIYCLLVNQDESILASGAQDKFVKIWCLKTYTLIYSYDDHFTYISDLSFFSNDNYLLSSSYKQIIVHNLKNHKNELILEAHTNMINAIKIVPGTKNVISISPDKKFKLWDLDDSEVKATLHGHSSYISCLDVSKDNKLIVSGAWDNTIIVWSIKDNRKKFVLKGHEHYISCLIICNDSKRAVSGSWDKTVRVWDLVNGKEIACFVGHTNNIFNLTQDHNSKHAFSSSPDYTVKCWSLKKLKEKFTLKFGHMLSSLIITKDNKYLITSCLDGTIFFTNIKTQMIEKKWNYDTGIYSLVISDDYEIMCFGLQDGSLYAINVYQNKILGTIKIGVSLITEFLMSANKKYLVVPNDKAQISILNLDNFTERCCFDCESQIKIVIFASKNNFLITGDQNATIKVWNIHEKRLELCFYGHTADVQCLCLTKNNKYLISGSRDFTVKIWKFEEFYGIINWKKKNDVTPDISYSLDLSDPKISKMSVKPINNFQDLSYIHHIYPTLTYQSFCQRLNKKLPPEAKDCKLLLPNCVNLAHIYSYLGQYSELSQALALGCTIRKDTFGHSPLYYALQKDSKKCVYTLLEFMIKLSKDHLKYQTYIQYNYALRDDLLQILKLPSPVITEYLESLFIVSKDKNLPNSLKCFIPPVLITTNHTKIYFYDFRNCCNILKKNESQENFVEFRTTPIKLNLTHGSSECFELLRSLNHSPNQKIFSTKLIMTIIDYKFRELRLVILLMTILLWVNLILMIICMLFYPDSISINGAYLFINILLAVHEIMEIFYEGILVYTMCWRNYLDLFSLVTSILRIVNNMFIKFDTKGTMWMMVILNFTKGLNGFRAFDNTRFYIRLMARTIKDIYSFLLIFCYTTVAFGALYSVSTNTDDSTFSKLWKIPYELNLGVFDSQDGFNLEFINFTLASSINVVMMLNLLISILGDSFDKFQIEAKEIDYKEKLSLVTELESLYLILRKRKRKGYVQLCDYNSNDENEEIWSGKIKEIEIKIDKLSKNLHKRLNGVDDRQEYGNKVYEELEKSILKMKEESNEKIEENTKKIGDIAMKIDLILKNIILDKNR